jgi:hypothetical protein
MNTSLRSRGRDGAAIVFTVTVMGVLGIAIAAYLSLVTARNNSTMRSQAWNACIAVAEAGVEEALAHARQNYITNMLDNSWTISGTNYFKTRDLDSNYFRVYISTNLPYVIRSEGYVFMPWAKKYVQRTIQISTISQGMYSKALVVKNSVQMNGNNVRVDSYDSRTSLKSTLGQYDVLKAQANGDVACTEGLINSVAVGNANIWGRVITGPQGSVAVGPNGAVGSVLWQINNNSGIEPNYWLTDMNMNFPAVKVPYTSGTAPSAGGSWDYVMGDGTYMIGDVNGKVFVKGNATLYVPGNVDITTLKIQNKANLNLYVGGNRLSFSTIQNENTVKNATNLCLYGLPTCKQLDISQNTDLTALIYMPSAKFKFNGGIEVSGCLVAAGGELTGHSQFHYDEALGPQGQPRAFIVSAWNEL